MKPKIITQTKEDKKRAKVLSKFMEQWVTDEEWEQGRKMLRIVEMERKINPLGKCYYWWDETKK